MLNLKLVYRYSSDFNRLQLICNYLKRITRMLNKHSLFTYIDFSIKIYQINCVFFFCSSLDVFWSVNVKFYLLINRLKREQYNVYFVRFLRNIVGRFYRYLIIMFELIIDINRWKIPAIFFWCSFPWNYLSVCKQFQFHETIGFSSYSTQCIGIHNQQLQTKENILRNKRNIK